MGRQLVSALRAAGLKNAVGTSEDDVIGRVARALMASHWLSGEEVERILKQAGVRPTEPSARRSGRFAEYDGADFRRRQDGFIDRCVGRRP
jgi:hypothetical protein